VLEAALEFLADQPVAEDVTSVLPLGELRRPAGSAAVGIVAARTIC
jgi:hypothetical protein